ncbi:MAG: S8 family serine peptidase, partial [Chlorobiales bacterium]|nr:S8 family serine peptidase [Chlorobiales bacterium]
AFSGHIWYSGHDSLGVLLVAPGGLTYGPFPIIPDSSQKVDGGHIVVYHSDYAINGDREVQILIQNKTGQNGWQVRLTDLRGTGCLYDGWRTGGVWTSHTTADKNITTPATADSALCVAAYDVAAGTIYSASSQGPTRTGKPKPEITAPTNVSTTAGTLTGTSAAAPHLAGLGAVLLQARPTLSVKAFMSALTDSAHHDAVTGIIPPHNIGWGFGKLYSLGALRHVLPRSGETMAINGPGKYLWRDQTGYAVLLNFSSESIQAVKVDVFPNTHPPFTGSRKAVTRYITLTPIGGSNFNATLRMYYADDEVASAGLTEATLQLYRYDSDTHVWTRMGGTVNASQNYVELSGVTAFSSWAISDPNSDSPLPVEFRGFSAQVNGDAVRLRWQTLSESDNMGFTIERCLEGDAFSLVCDYRTQSSLKSKGLVGGDYAYDDVGLDAGVFFYRLSSQDVNGTRHDLQTIRVEVTQEGRSESKFAYRLYQNYPNPFNPETVIRFDIEARSILTMEVFNLLGQCVSTVMQNKSVEAGNHSVKFNAQSLPSGMYFCRMQVWPQTGLPKFFTKKMLLTK